MVELGNCSLENNGIIFPKWKARLPPIKNGRQWVINTWRQFVCEHRTGAAGASRPWKSFVCSDTHICPPPPNDPANDAEMMKACLL